jgi:hypothetical protein
MWLYWLILVEPQQQVFTGTHPLALDRHSRIRGEFTKEIRNHSDGRFCAELESKLLQARDKVSRSFENFNAPE